MVKIGVKRLRERYLMLHRTLGENTSSAFTAGAGFFTLASAFAFSMF
jgi:hypothetical protein